MHFLQSKMSYESHQRAAAARTAGTCLGWASIAVGLTEILAPKQLERTMGVGNGQTTGILRVLGIREIMHGVDLLAHKDATCGLLGRSAGDLLDGVLLGIAAKKTKKPSGFLAICMLVLPVVLADIVFAERFTARKLGG